MTRAALVIGAGGLLGRAVVSALTSVGVDVVPAPIRWSSDERDADLVAAVDRLAAAPADSRWIVWAAGAGVTSTPRPTLFAEVAAFERFVAALRDRASTLGRVSLVLASSVGGAYAGSSGAPFTESTTPVALSAYGEAKLLMERIALEAETPVMVGRFSNLYGPDQNPAKQQGLVSAIARAAVTGQPVGIYVSFDTIRDYLYVDDAAAMVVAALRRLDRSDEQCVKILASGVGVTIAALLAEFRRVWHRPVRTVASALSGAGQAPDLRVRSIHWPEIDALATTTLPDGIGRLLRGSLLERQAR